MRKYTAEWFDTTGWHEFVYNEPMAFTFGPEYDHSLTLNIRGMKVVAYAHVEDGETMFCIKVDKR